MNAALILLNNPVLVAVFAIIVVMHWRLVLKAVGAGVLTICILGFLFLLAG